MLATVYLHSSKDSMTDKAEALGLKGEAAIEFKYALSEVKVELEVDEATGLTKIITVDDRKVLT